MSEELVKRLRALERQSEDNIWRTAKEAADALERMEGALETIAAFKDRDRPMREYDKGYQSCGEYCRAIARRVLKESE